MLDDGAAPFYRWFTGATLNTCFNALDRHVDNGRAHQTALVYDSPVTRTVALWTFRQVRDSVARFDGALAGQGVGKGDRVLIYMPMVPQAVIESPMNKKAIAPTTNAIVTRLMWRLIHSNKRPRGRRLWLSLCPLKMCVHFQS